MGRTPATGPMATMDPTGTVGATRGAPRRPPRACVLGAVVALAGLAGLAAPTACDHRDPPPLSGSVPPAARPTTPPPRVAWRKRDIAITGLPAIADDGSAVVIAHRDSDGGRGNPNLTLIEKDRGDRVVSRLPVITADEVDQLDAAQIERRFRDAASWLEDRHATRHLLAMTTLEAHPPTDEAPASATGRGVTVRWVPNQLVIDFSPGVAARPSLQRGTPPSWLAPDRPMCATCTEICHNDAFLDGGYADLPRRVMLVVVSFRGGDTCPEPGSEAHVVTW